MTRGTTLHRRIEARFNALLRCVSTSLVLPRVDVAIVDASLVPTPPVHPQRIVITFKDITLQLVAIASINDRRSYTFSH